MTVLAWYTLDALDTVCAVLSIFTIGYSKGCGSTICESDCVCIYQTFGRSLFDGAYAVTSFTLNSFGKNVSIYSINIPISILDCNYRCMTIFTWFTLNTLDTLGTVLTIFTIGYSKGCGSTICESDCVCIYQTFGRSLFDGAYAVTSFTLNSFGKNISIYTVNVPITVLNCNNWGVAIFTWYTLNTLDTLGAVLTIFTIGYSKGCGCAISKCNCICIYQTFGKSLFDRANAVTGFTLNTFS